MADLNSLSRAFYWHPEHSPSLDRVEAFARQVTEAVLDEAVMRIDLNGTAARGCDVIIALKRELCGKGKKS